MPPIERAHRTETAVLWAAIGYNSHGEVIVDTPEEITVRWEKVTREALDPKGNTVAVEVDVVVNQEIEDGSLLRLGTLDDWYDTGSAGSDTGLMQVVTRDIIQDIKGRSTRRTLGLMRFRDNPLME